MCRRHLKIYDFPFELACIWAEKLNECESDSRMSGPCSISLCCGCLASSYGRAHPQICLTVLVEMAAAQRCSICARNVQVDCHQKSAAFRAFTSRTLQHAGPNVQRFRPAGAVSEGVGEERLQGRQVGQEGVQIRRLQHPNMSDPVVLNARP